MRPGLIAFVLASMFGVASLATPSARADEAALSYAGRLTDAQGAPLAGPVDLTVRFFRQAVGGSPVGRALALPHVALAHGVFQVSLPLTPGDITAVFGDGSEAVYVEVEAAGKTYPRQRFGVVPYALRVGVDGTTIGYDAQGRLTVGPPTTPGANQFLTKDASGALVWGTPSTNATELGGAAVATGSPAAGQVLKYTGGAWQAANDVSAVAQGLQALSGAPASPVRGQAWLDTSSNQIKFYDGTSVQTLGTSGAGLQSLNGELGNTQSFATPAIGGTSAAWVSASNVHTLVLPVASGSAAAGLLTSADYASFQGKVARGGDAMTGNLTTTASIGIGTSSPATALDVAGVVTQRGVAAPAVSAAGQGRLYFDATAERFLVSQNGGAFAPLATGTPVTAVTAGTGLTGGGSSGSVTVSLANVGVAGTYAKVATDAQGRVTGGGSLTAADLPTLTAGMIAGTLATAQLPTIPAAQLGGTLAAAQLPAIPAQQLSGTLAAAQLPPIPSTQVTGTLAASQLPPIAAGSLSGTLSISQLPGIPVGQLSGTLAVAQLPPIPAAQVVGTLASAQLPAIPAMQLTGTVPLGQIPPLPASQIASGTLALAQLPALPAAQITSGTLALAQVPALPAAQITSGTLALARLPGLPASQITSGTLAAAQLPPLSAAEITAGTLAVSLGGTGATSFSSGGVLVGAGSLPLAAVTAASQYQVLQQGASGPVFQSLRLDQPAAVSGILPVANGGTGSGTALGNNRLMLSAAGKIVEAPALTNGQLLLGSTGAAPVAASLTQGATQGVVLSAGAGSLALDTVQDIRTSASPQFAAMILANPGVGSVLKVGTGGTLVAATAGDLTAVAAMNVVNRAGDSMTGALSLPFNGLNVGTQQLTFNANGVGIGTTSPQRHLHLYSTTAPYMELQYGVSSGGSGFDFNDEAGNKKWTLLNYGDANTTLRNTFALYQWTDQNDATVNQWRFTVSDIGYVGIGTSSPANKLQIGSVGASGYSGNQFAIGNGTQVMAIDTGAPSTTFYTNTNFSFMPSGVGSVGRVGIGTTSPTAELDMAGGTVAMGYETITNDCASTYVCLAYCSAGKKALGGGCVSPGYGTGFGGNTKSCTYGSYGGDCDNAWMCVTAGPTTVSKIRATVTCANIK